MTTIPAFRLSKKSALLVGYLVVSSITPFMLSYRESNASHELLRGSTSKRNLFNKIWSQEREGEKANGLWTKCKSLEASYILYG